MQPANSGQRLLPPISCYWLLSFLATSSHCILAIKDTNMDDTTRVDTTSKDRDKDRISPLFWA
jgi:hypothetical protein